VNQAPWRRPIGGRGELGQDIVLGDNGFVNWDTAGLLTQFGSSDPALRQRPDRRGDGPNIVVAGSATTRSPPAPCNIVLGDDGSRLCDGRRISSDIDLIQSTSTTLRRRDTIVRWEHDIVIAPVWRHDRRGDGNNVVIATAARSPRTPSMRQLVDSRSPWG